MSEPGQKRSDRRPITADERSTLERWVRSGTTPQRTAMRSRIILMLHDGLSAREVARRLGVNRHTVVLWDARYAEQGSAALTQDKPGRGRKRTRSMLSRA
jgi:transposase-like protein